MHIFFVSYLWVFDKTKQRSLSGWDNANAVQRVPCNHTALMLHIDSKTPSWWDRKLSGPTAHGLLNWRNHNQEWLSIEPRMRHPTTDLTTFLTKRTWVAEDMSRKVTCRLTLFTLHLILYKASTAPTCTMKCLTAALFII